jgi:hypothetical protein
MFVARYRTERKTPMSKTNRAMQLHALKELDAKAKRLRKALGISAPNEVTYQADLDDDKVVVTADGLGGAELEIVEGNFPVDYQRKRSKTFDSEDKAYDAACRIYEFSNGSHGDKKGIVFLSDLYDEIFGKQ